MTLTLKSFYANGVVIAAAALVLSACSHNQQLLDPKTSTAMTPPPSAEEVAATQNYSPEMKRKVAQAEQLKKLQVQVYELQDRVYGNNEYGSMGLYGALRECKAGIADKKNGGNGTLTWSEPIDRVADRESRLQALDDPSQLEKVTEASLLERQKRFQGYREVLDKRQDDLEDKLEICRGELKAHKDSETEPAPGVKHDHEPDKQEPL